MAQNNSPIFLLPPELTSTIFRQCLPSHQEGVLNRRRTAQKPSPSQAPLLLAQICSQWREICLGTPELWANVSFCQGSGTAELLQTWLSRVGTYPLSLAIESKDDGTRADAFMSTVMVYCRQWQDIYLALPPSTYLQLSQSQGSFPALRSLDLSTKEPLKERLAIRDALLLRDVRVTYVANVDLPWAQLTRLFVHWFDDAAQAVAVLRSCPALLDVTYFSIKNQTVTAPPLTHALQSLSAPTVGVLQYLTLPHLERLTLRYTPPDIATATATLQSLLSRSSCDLQFLSMRTGSTSATDLRLFLRVGNPSIVHLKLLFFYPDGFSHQIQVLRDTSVLPRLRHLEIRDSAGDNYGPLLDILRARCAVNLESVDLILIPRGYSLTPTPGRFPPPTIMAQFRALADTGLKLRIETRSRAEASEGRRPHRQVVRIYQSSPE
ncbi:hypothetical protein C8R43DRAFT_976954 [Mycena crocata]|nr:hypothetical protein C8R43DRAFT_976954 [Mycena crocata]